jgi:glutamate decarboxylase
MENKAERLIIDTLSKNIVNHDAYPATTEIHNRCVNILARLFHAPPSSSPLPTTTTPSQDREEAIGTSTVGSSEAILLAVLAMKKRWASKRKAAGKDYSRPNIIMSSAVQVCWKKATRYFDVEERYVYCSKNRYTIDPGEAVELVDEHTIGICAILGTTYTGEYEDVEGLNGLLVERGLDVPIHVDAASGGFVAPFIHPEVVWDFRLENVVSINTSGHKFGFVFAGIGWLIWRGADYLPHGELSMGILLLTCAEN